MFLLKKLTFLFFLVGYAHSLFVPEQLTTLLSFIYTNIPPIRKGTDSRVGFGFRLGPNADFQVMVELGPQESTQALGPGGTNSKRETYNEEDYQPGGGDWTAEDSSQQQQPLDQDIVNHLRQLYKKKEKPTKKEEEPVTTS